MACTGIEFCKLALVETKARARTVVAELERRLPHFDAPFSIHVNGCPNSCARTQVADVGLKGMVQKGDDGELVEVFQVHLGGSLGSDPALARKTRALKVRAEDLPDYVERLAGRYSSSASRRSPLRPGPAVPTRRTSSGEPRDDRDLLLPVLRRGGPASRGGAGRLRPARPARVFTVGLVTVDTTQIPGRLAEQERIGGGQR